MLIDSVQVDTVLTPSTTDELSGMMRSETGTIAPVGGGTQLSIGNPLDPIDTAIETRKLDKVTEYVPGDLTVHVESGVRLKQLAVVLGEYNQMIPLDPWTDPEATIGGIVATNVQGPLHTVGRVRDWIIGMKVVQVGGRQSKTGGRVVKNVSGYDLGKLYTGSFGSLAVISEISFKLRAQYETTATARIYVDGFAAAEKIIQEIRSGPFEPISLVWSGPPHTIAVRFGEHPHAVKWQLEQLPSGDWERLDQTSEKAVWEDVAHQYRRLTEPVVRVAALPSQVRYILERFEPKSWLVHAANGTILMTVDMEDILRLRQEFHAVIERASLGVRKKIPTFGLKGDEFELMSKLKMTFDPEGRLNPGRHVDGEQSR